MQIWQLGVLEIDTAGNECIALHKQLKILGLVQRNLLKR
jgi:hypothetical protein